MDRYQKLAVLGAGSFGKVYKVKNRETQDIFVLKRIALTQGEEAKIRAFAEVDVLQNIKHPHVTKVIEHFWDEEEQDLCVIMSYCEEGDMFTLIQKKWEGNAFVEEEDVWRFLTQMLSALAYLHSELHIMHRDLKTQNVFMTRPNGGKLITMIGDFGLAKKLEETFAMAKTPLGTPFYMAPEILEGKNYNYKSDMWALGCIGYELCTRDAAFGASTFPGVANKVLRGEYEPMPAIYSETLQKVVRALLSKDPKARPMAHELLYSDVFAPHLQDYRDEMETSGLGYQLWSRDGHRKPRLKVSVEDLPDPVKKKSSLTPLDSLQGSAKKLPALQSPRSLGGKKLKKKVLGREGLRTPPSDGGGLGDTGVFGPGPSTLGRLPLGSGEAGAGSTVSASGVELEEATGAPEVGENVYEEDFEQYDDDFEDEYADEEWESDTEDNVDDTSASLVLQNLRRERLEKIRIHLQMVLGDDLFGRMYDCQRCRSVSLKESSSDTAAEAEGYRELQLELDVVVGEKEDENDVLKAKEDLWKMLDELIFYEDQNWHLQ